MADGATLWTVTSGGGGILLGALGYLYKNQARIWKELDDFKLKCAETYVTSVALKELKADMEKRFDKIEEILLRGSK